MARLLDKVLVVDIEATCWNGKVPSDFTSDIIEIGLCMLDIETYEITDSRSILVRPERSEISNFCTDLTSITPEMINNDGISFREACLVLKNEYISQSRVWASFGAYDIHQFQKQCTELNIPYPFGSSHLNVKTLFALKKKLKKEQGMAGALAIAGIELEGRHHRGIDDAKNIAKILSWILR